METKQQRERAFHDIAFLRTDDEHLTRACSSSHPWCSAMPGWSC